MLRKYTIEFESVIEHGVDDGYDEILGVQLDLKWVARMSSDIVFYLFARLLIVVGVALVELLGDAAHFSLEIEQALLLHGQPFESEMENLFLYVERHEVELQITLSLRDTNRNRIELFNILLFLVAFHALDRAAIVSEYKVLDDRLVRC